MMGTDFKRVIVIGYGKAAGEILKLVHEKSSIYGYKMNYVEYEIYPFNAAKRYARENHIEIWETTDRVQLLNRFLQVKEKTLIVSAGNHYLFPRELTDSPGFRIVNFHNALLPGYPGRNAPSWAIYKGEEITGMTWHYVDSGIDTGDIIIQKECRIGPDTRAYELAGQLMQMAVEGFRDCAEKIFQETVSVTPQSVAGARVIYRSTDVPGGARFCMEDSPESIYRLLRSLDYGKNHIFPPATALYEGRWIRIQSYKKIPREVCTNCGNTIQIPFNGEYSLKLKYCELTEKI